MNTNSSGDWIKVEDCMPPPGQKVHIRGYDIHGEWKAVAWWVPYKGRPPKGTKKHGRWLWKPQDKIERIGGYGDVDLWQPIR